MFTSLLGPKVILEDFSETVISFWVYQWLVFSTKCGDNRSDSPVFGGFLVHAGLGYGLSSWPDHFHIRFNNRWFIAALSCLQWPFWWKTGCSYLFYDCGLYYIQTIRWAQIFPVCPLVWPISTSRKRINVAHSDFCFWLATSFSRRFWRSGRTHSSMVCHFSWLECFQTIGLWAISHLSLVFFAIWQAKHLLAAGTRPGKWNPGNANAFPV